jgi:hypothetical protein
VKSISVTFIEIIPVAKNEPKLPEKKFEVPPPRNEDKLNSTYTALVGRDDKKSKIGGGPSAAFGAGGKPDIAKIKAEKIFFFGYSKKRASCPTSTNLGSSAKDTAIKIGGNIFTNEICRQLISAALVSAR